MFRRQTPTDPTSDNPPTPASPDGQPVPVLTPLPSAAFLPGSTLASRKVARQARNLPEPPDQLWHCLGEQEIRYPPDGGKLGYIRKCTVWTSYPNATHYRIAWEDGTTDVVMIHGSGLKESVRHLGYIPHAQFQANSQRAIEQLDRRSLQQRGGGMPMLTP